MPQFALTTAFALIPTLLGTLSTYLYEDDASPSWRVAAGACTGFAALGLLGFATAFSMRISAVPFSVAIVAITLIAALASNEKVRRSFSNDAQDGLNRMSRAVAHPALKAAFRVIATAVAVAL